jgi:small conductance mechanosensitive channel
MKPKHPAFFRVLGLTFTLLFLSAGVLAKDCPTDIKPVTNDDPKVPVDVLAQRVKPLTKCELEVEAQAWLLLLKAKVTEISNAEVAVIYKKEQKLKAEQAATAVKEATEAQQAKHGEDEKEIKKATKEAKEAVKQAKEVEKKLATDQNLQKQIETAKGKAEETEEKKDVKTALVVHVTDLVAERTALIDRMNVVLAELKAKGGDPKEYETYIKAVSGIKVDVTDAGATWTTITRWLTSAEGGLRWALNIVKFIIIVFVFYLLSIALGKAAQRAFAKAQHLSTMLRHFLVIATRRLVLVIGFFVGLSALEVNVGPVLAVIGAAGFVIAFALQNSLSNFASGILMLIYRPFDIGDVVNVAGVVGKVESMHLLSTQLRTGDNQLQIVPNNSVWGGVITNITGITQRRVDLVFGIGYSDDIDKAQHILEDITTSHAKVLKDPAPVIKLHELADSSVNFIVRPWVNPADYWDVYWDITREVKRRFDAEGISIPFPQRDVHLYQETSR